MTRPRTLRPVLIALLMLAALVTSAPRSTPFAAVVAYEGTASLAFHQVSIPLDCARWDCQRLSQLRVHAREDGRWLPHWIERDAAHQPAALWVKLPELRPNTPLTLTLRFDPTAREDLSEGRRVFEMFDDFGKPGLGYFRFSEPTTIMERSLPWETEAPHTLSVIALEREGYRFWGYYGLANCGGIGLARSNDLVHWEKHPEPLLIGDGERWPSVLLVEGTVYMAYDRDHCGTSHVVLRTSRDGVHFDPAYRVLVQPEPGIRNQNPNLFRDPRDGRFYLYWFRGGNEAGFWQIRVRSAARIEDLADPSSERVLLEAPYELAAPNMMVLNDEYFLSTEVNENAWKTRIYIGASPLGPFTLLPDAPQLSDNQACLFQHIFGDVMHGYICKVIGTTWVLQHRAADLRAGRLRERVLDRGVWVPYGEWAIRTEGTETFVIGNGMLRTALFGSDYHFEAKGRGEAWGIGVHVRTDAQGNLLSMLAAQVMPTRTLQLVAVEEETQRVLAETALPSDQAGDRFVKLGLRAHNAVITAYLADQPILSATLGAPPPPGHAALLALLPGKVAAFDDVRWRKAASGDVQVRLASAVP